MVPVTFGRRAVECTHVPHAGKCSCLFGSLLFSHPQICGLLGFGQQCCRISSGAEIARGCMGELHFFSHAERSLDPKRRIPASKN